MNSVSHRPGRTHGASFVVHQSAFTLIEVLVVVGIIVLLSAFLLPAIQRVRNSSYSQVTNAWLSQLANAIDDYNRDQRAYPGPLGNGDVGLKQLVGNPGTKNMLPDTTPAAQGFASATWSTDYANITMPENLVLGLLGGLRVDQSAQKLYYSPQLIGRGPSSLNAVGAVKQFGKYIEDKNVFWRDDGGLKSGKYEDDGGKADDTIIPEFVDTFPAKMPILYMRAKKGAMAIGPLNGANNSIVTYDNSTPTNRVGQYDLHQIIAYTGSKIGEGKTVPAYAGWGGTPPAHGISAVTSADIDPTNASGSPTPPSGMTYKYPYDAYVYLRNPALSSPTEADSNYTSGVGRNDVPYQKDSFLLISAGPDRVYGTKDDLTNFGGVAK